MTRPSFPGLVLSPSNHPRRELSSGRPFPVYRSKQPPSSSPVTLVAAAQIVVLLA